MRKSISEKIRLLVAKRANYCCEYCLVHQDYQFLAFDIDHIVSVKHGGGNEITNFAFACPHCN